jgi:hypothetical protein
MASDNKVFWPFVPEYEMTEELEWLTDVITCPKGEDRIPLRGDPRQSLQYSAYMEDAYMAEAKNTSRQIVNEFYIPYWPVALRLPQQVGDIPNTYLVDGLGNEHKGVGLFLLNDTRDYRSYSERESGVLLDGETLGWGDTWGHFYDGIEGPLVWVFKFDPLDDFKIAGSTMVPQTLSVLEQPIDFSFRGGNLWEVNIRATNTLPPLQVFDYVPRQYKGIDIFDLLNYSSTLTEQHFTEVDNVQSDSGIIQSVATLGRPETLTSLGFHATTPEEVDAMKSWIYSRAGRLIPFWVRSNSNDFHIERGFEKDPTNSNRTIITVRRVQGLKAPFKVSALHRNGSEEFLTCIIAQDMGNDTHTLVFKENTTRNWAKGDTIDLRMMIYARFDSDRVELKYESGGNLLAQVPVRELYYNFNND